ncbi:uncharacterized protein FMAN_11280 [Fusarium mangiferae]|uniref:Flavin reductase like domain-containing protein n=1 Tax=Fusarium mangiferae TaxID=192010 RepID=A0A1L7TP20_FUSMA|nr:uncharacterized protein FMAN_11280 [Fusarium mangiferae]CVK97037.1 uncharacterized protein FMAN_11280 [Fusarium mangiferae]
MKSSRALRNGAATVLVMTRSGTRGFSSLRNTGCLQRSIRGMDVGGRYMASVSGSRSSQSALHHRRNHTTATATTWHTSPAKPPTVHPTKQGPLSEQLRSIMRLLPHSVVVCTSNQPGDGPRAMTMSSFTSLTLAPTPLVTFNIATPSRTLDAIRASGGFNVHILSGDERGANVASHFTKGNFGGNAFKGLEYTQKDDEAPIIREDGVMFALRCRVLQDAPEGGLLRVRDHVIVVGEVVEMVRVGEEEDEDFGLVYADRKYREVGVVLEM